MELDPGVTERAAELFLLCLQEQQLTWKLKAVRTLIEAEQASLVKFNAVYSDEVFTVVSERFQLLETSTTERGPQK